MSPSPYSPHATQAGPSATRPDPWRRITGGPTRFVGTMLVVAVLAGGSWLAWMGFHAEYDVDPVTGSASGPYEVSQGVGLGLCLIAIVFLAAWLFSPAGAAVGGVVGLVLTVSYDWATEPGADGLWIIGAFMLAFGASAGAALIATIGALLPRPGGRA